MPGLVPGIGALAALRQEPWMAGTTRAMTSNICENLSRPRPAAYGTNFARNDVV